jgi:ribonucleotide reductase alpha subunit
LKQKEEVATGGLKIGRFFTSADTSPYEQFSYVRRSSVIRHPSGEVVFEMKAVEVPVKWSQISTDILAQKYFRKTGVPQPDGSLGGETSVQQVVHRLADCWRDWGFRYGYFASGADADAFYDEVVYMLLGQYAAPNSPQWFNTGLYRSYGIEGASQGHFYVEPESRQLKESRTAYERPQPHACFILSVQDDLVNEGGIMDLFLREARIFKYGSGVGTNYSAVRGANERLSGGGYSSGLMSFLKVGDRAAGAIKSGGTTRRAAKMVCLDLDHPEIEEFLTWKQEEEKKVAALIAAGYSADYEGEAYRTVSGQNSNNSVRIPNSFFEALDAGTDWELTARTDGQVVKRVPAQELWAKLVEAAWSCADPGVQFSSTIDAWHTCPADGPIRASNPCSEYLFLDDTACNLASLNLRRFFDEEKQEFNVEAFTHACRLWTIVLEISVLMAQFPTREVADCFRQAWELGLKACTVYRDGSKLSQPLSQQRKKAEAVPKSGPAEPTAADAPVKLTEEQVLEAAQAIMAEAKDTRFKRALSNIVQRKRLPDKRNGFTQKAKIDGHTIYVRTGEYTDGSLGEIFLDMYKEGASFRSLLNCFAISVSLGLQYGVPLEEFVSRFTFTRFEPAGRVEHPNIKQATSIFDYLFRLLAYEYLHRTDLVHVQPEEKPAEEASQADLYPTLPLPSGNRTGKQVVLEHKQSFHLEQTQQVLASLMVDAPVCPTCGHITIRSGTCYKCLNCGASLGCS